MRLLSLLLLLAGCASQVPVAVPVNVDVPLVVSCHAELIAEPDWNVPRLARNATTIDKLKAALADLDISKGYIEELQTELEACS